MLKTADFKTCTQAHLKRWLVFFVLCCIADKVWGATTACPKLMQPNRNLSECECIWGTKSADGKSCKNVKLTKENLKCGPEGCKAPLEKQCWTKISDKQAYRKCMGFDGFGSINSNTKTANSSDSTTAATNNSTANNDKQNVVSYENYENVDLSKMTEQQACEYWKGRWENNTCKNPYGPGKSSRFKVIWFSKEKKFKCLNVPEQVEQGFANGTGDHAEWVEEHKQDIKDRPWAYAEALWDPIVNECTSKSERACRDKGIGSWSSENNKCYLFTENKPNCEAIGAKYQETSTTQKCDCVLDDRELHWTKKDGCVYEYTKPAVFDGKTYFGKQYTGGIVPNTQSSPVELCVEGLVKHRFMAKGEKLPCK